MDIETKAMNFVKKGSVIKTYDMLYNNWYCVQYGPTKFEPKYDKRKGIWSCDCMNFIYTKGNKKCSHIRACELYEQERARSKDA